jgi:hypothetical protein
MEGSLRELDPQAELVFPHDTVSALIDWELGVLRIFAEPEPDPEDWRQAQQLAGRVAGGGWDCYSDAGVDVFDVRIVANALDAVA